MCLRYKMCVQFLVLIISSLLFAADVSSCPSQCTCRYNWKGTQMVCQSTSMSVSNIIAEMPSNIQILVISGVRTPLSFLSQSDFITSTSSSISLNELSIQDTNLAEIQDYAFQSLSSLRYLRLMNNQISRISKQGFGQLSALQLLDLSGNRIMSITDIFLPLTSLRSLDISKNQISSNIPAGAFSSQTYLNTLNLNNNQLGTLNGASFQSLSNLRILYMRECSIDRIGNDFFGNVNKVETMDLGNNRLYTLPGPNQFRQMPSLRNLSLQNNNIAALQDFQFGNLNLDLLDLSHNQISQVSGSHFSQLQVRKLDLSHNLLSSIGQDTFHSMGATLQVLRLEENTQITHLHENLFQGLSYLRELNLSRCQLQTLNKYQLSFIQFPVVLDLSYNKIKHFPQEVVDKFNQLGSLSLVSNSWHCDCHIRPLRAWLKGVLSQRILSCPFNTPYQTCAPTCITPQKLTSVPVSALRENDIEVCPQIGSLTSLPKNLGLIVGILVAIIVLGIIIAVVACFLYRRHKRGEPLIAFCGDTSSEKQEQVKHTKPKLNSAKFEKKKKKSKRKKKDEYYEEKKERRSIDPDVGSLNESDKSFVVRNFFHSMVPNPEVVSRGTPSVTRRGSDSPSASGMGSQLSLTGEQLSQCGSNYGYRIESAV